jgi:hypothetical protein
MREALIAGNSAGSAPRDAHDDGQSANGGTEIEEVTASDSKSGTKLSLLPILLVGSVLFV